MKQKTYFRQSGIAIIAVIVVATLLNANDDYGIRDNVNLHPMVLASSSGTDWGNSGTGTNGNTGYVTHGNEWGCYSATNGFAVSQSQLFRKWLDGIVGRTGTMIDPVICNRKDFYTGLEGYWTVQLDANGYPVYTGFPPPEQTVIPCGEESIYPCTLLGNFTVYSANTNLIDF